jgi:hypothetical protein
MPSEVSRVYLTLPESTQVRVGTTLLGQDCSPLGSRGVDFLKSFCPELFTASTPFEPSGPKIALIILQQQQKIKLIHMLKVKKNGESLGIWDFKIIGSRTVAYGARISQLR